MLFTALSAGDVEYGEFAVGRNFPLFIGINKFNSYRRLRICIKFMWTIVSTILFDVLFGLYCNGIFICGAFLGYSSESIAILEKIIIKIPISLKMPGFTGLPECSQA